MAEDYCSTWSAWRIWFHPRLALDTLEDSGFMQEKLEQQLSEALARLDSEKQQNSLLAGQNKSLSERIEEMATHFQEIQKTLDSATSEIAILRAELNERQEVEEQFRAFDEKLSKVENLKMDYENRLKACGKEQEIYKDTIEKYKRRLEESDKKIADLQSKLKDSRNNSDLKFDNPKNSNSDEWLMDLPEDFI